MRREVGQPLHAQNFRQHGVDREAMGSNSDTLEVSFRQTTHRVGNSLNKRLLISAESADRVTQEVFPCITAGSTKLLYAEIATAPVINFG